MDFSKVSTIILVLLLGSFCEATRRSILEHRSNDRSGESTPLDSTCVCVPNGENSQYVTDMIEADKQRVERLVVYFYIDTQTQKISAYTPNIERQHIFPDLSFELGDDFEPVLPNESIQIFVAHKANKIIPIDSINDINIDVNVPDFVPNAPTEINVGETDSIDTQHLQSIIDTNENIDNVVLPENEAEVHIHANDNADVIDNINLDSSNANDILYAYLHGHKSDAKLQSLHEIPIDDVSDGWLTNAIGNIHKISHVYQKPITYPQNINAESFLKFDQWFQNQMDSVINKHHFNHPDDSVLKSLIYKYLYQNGRLLMDDGIFKTHQGHVVNLANLKLQPIALGVSLGYNRPISGVHTKVVGPYYDAIALSIAHPQKVLGIIPINTYGMMSSSLHTTHCSNNQCFTSTIPGPLSFRTAKPSEKETAPKDSQEEHGRSALNPGKQAVHIIHSSGDPLNLFNVKHAENSRSRKNLRGIPGVSGVLNTLYHILLDEELSRAAGKKKPKFEDHLMVDEGPEFRIVGGSAATGSGTPVSSRGRTALE